MFELLGRELPSITLDSLDIDRLKDNLKIEQSENGLTGRIQCIGHRGNGTAGYREGFRLVSAEAEISSGGVTGEDHRASGGKRPWRIPDDCCDFTGARKTS